MENMSVDVNEAISLFPTLLKRDNIYITGWELILMQICHLLQFMLGKKLCKFLKLFIRVKQNAL